MGDIYYGLAELKRMIGNNLNKMANDIEVAACMDEATDEEEIFFTNLAECFRQMAEEKFFAKMPPRYEGNVIDWDEHYEKRRG